MSLETVKLLKSAEQDTVDVDLASLYEKRPSLTVVVNGKDLPTILVHSKEYYKKKEYILNKSKAEGEETDTCSYSWTWNQFFYICWAVPMFACLCWLWSLGGYLVPLKQYGWTAALQNPSWKHETTYSIALLCLIFFFPSNKSVRKRKRTLVHEMENVVATDGGTAENQNHEREGNQGKTMVQGKAIAVQNQTPDIRENTSAATRNEADRTTVNGDSKELSIRPSPAKPSNLLLSPHEITEGTGITTASRSVPTAGRNNNPQENDNPAEPKKIRHDYLDNLKSSLIFLVVMGHTGITFGPNGSNSSFFLANIPNNFSWIGSVVVVILALPVMPIFFFVAGFFTPTSVSKFGVYLFIKKRLFRYGLPLLATFFLLFPFAQQFFMYNRIILPRTRRTGNFRTPRNTPIRGDSSIRQTFSTTTASEDPNISIFDFLHFDTTFAWFLQLLLIFCGLFALVCPHGLEDVPKIGKFPSVGRLMFYGLVLGIIQCWMTIWGFAIYNMNLGPTPWAPFCGFFFTAGCIAKKSGWLERPDSLLVCHKDGIVVVEDDGSLHSFGDGDEEDPDDDNSKWFKDGMEKLGTVEDRDTELRKKDKEDEAIQREKATGVSATVSRQLTENNVQDKSNVVSGQGNSKDDSEVEISNDLLVKSDINSEIMNHCDASGQGGCLRANDRSEEYLQEGADRTNSLSAIGPPGGKGKSRGKQAIIFDSLANEDRRELRSSSRESRPRQSERQNSSVGQSTQRRSTARQSLGITKNAVAKLMWHPRASEIRLLYIISAIYALIIIVTTLFVQKGQVYHWGTAGVVVGGSDGKRKTSGEHSVDASLTADKETGDEESPRKACRDFFPTGEDEVPDGPQLSDSSVVSPITAISGRFPLGVNANGNVELDVPDVRVVRPTVVKVESQSPPRSAERQSLSAGHPSKERHSEERLSLKRGSVEREVGSESSSESDGFEEAEGDADCTTTTETDAHASEVDHRTDASGVEKRPEFLARTDENYKESRGRARKSIKISSSTAKRSSSKPGKRTLSKTDVKDHSVDRNEVAKMFIPSRVFRYFWEAQEMNHDQVLMGLFCILLGPLAVLLSVVLTRFFVYFMNFRNSLTDKFAQANFGVYFFHLYLVTPVIYSWMLLVERASSWQAVIDGRDDKAAAEIVPGTIRSGTKNWLWSILCLGDFGLHYKESNLKDGIVLNQHWEHHVIDGVSQRVYFVEKFSFDESFTKEEYGTLISATELNGLALLVGFVYAVVVVNLILWPVCYVLKTKVPFFKAIL